jgi:hypothetical protein
VRLCPDRGALVIGFNPYSEVSIRYDRLCRMVEYRYGKQAQAIILVLYDHLIALRSILADDPDAFVVRARAAGVARVIAERYEQHGFQPVRNHPTAVVGTDPVVIEFSRDEFETRYRSVAALLHTQTMELTSAEVPFARSGRPYMFVIDDEGRFLVWAREFTFEELVFGRNRATVDGVPVGHPMLVPQRLRATAAGEIVFIGAPHVRAVIVNNKSGHFRFPPSCREVILERCRTVLGLSPDDVEIFIVGGIDEHRVHRIGRPAQASVAGTGSRL